MARMAQMEPRVRPVNPETKEPLAVQDWMETLVKMGLMVTMERRGKRELQAHREMLESPVFKVNNIGNSCNHGLD